MKLYKIITGLLILFSVNSVLLAQTSKKSKKQTSISRAKKDSTSKSSLSSSRKAIAPKKEVKGKRESTKEE